MSGKINWADDDDSSDEEDVEEEPTQTTQSNNTPVQQQQQQQAEGQGHVNVTETSASTSSSRSSRQQNTQLPDSPPYVAFVSNLSYKLDENTIGNFFYDGGCDVKDVRIQLNKDGLPRGMALVEFKSRQGLEVSLGAHGTELEGRAISVSVSDRPHRRRGDRRDNRNNDREGGGRDREGGRRRNDNRDGDWSRGDVRGRREKDSPRGAPPIPNPSSETGSSNTTAPVRPKLNLVPRQIPLDNNANVERNSSIFGEGKPREDPSTSASTTPTASVTQEVKELSVNSEKANKDVDNLDEDKKKQGSVNQKPNQKSPRDTSKPDRVSPREYKKDMSGSSKKDRKGERKNNTPKAQDRKSGNNDNKSRRDKEKNVESQEDAARARFVAANEKLQKPVKVDTAVTKKPMNAFSALASDDSDSDSGS